MNRATWQVAWRHARRLINRRGAGEHEIYADTARQLGRPLPLTNTCTALECWQARHHDAACEVLRRARTKRFYKLAELCGDRWEAEARSSS